MVEPRGFTVIAGMVTCIVVGALLTSTVVFAVPGVALICYGLVFPLFETWDVVWDRVERFADWWGEGR